MTTTIIFLALVFGGIAVWAGIGLMNCSDKPVPRPRNSQRPVQYRV